MVRTRKSAKGAGATFERQTADYLAEHVDDRIDRRVRTGAKDRGDIAGVRLSPALRGGRVMLECKNEARVSLGVWQGEVDAQRGNDDATVGATVHKRHGVAAAGRQWVTMELDDLIGLLTGIRPA